MSISYRGRQFKKGVIFPLFLEVSEKCKDDYWKQFFLDLSIGKIIKGVQVSNGHILSTNKKKGFSYYFIKKTPDDLINELIPILIGNCNTCPDKNVKLKSITEKIKKENEEIKLGKWTKIRRKNIKVALLQEYLSELQKNNNLSWQECSYAYNILNNNINTSIMSKIVNLENGKITNIKGLEIIYGKLVFEHDFYTNVKEEKKCTEESDDDTEKNVNEEMESIVDEKLENMWDSYIKRYFKTIRMMLS
jgi:hypothetical protein